MKYLGHTSIETTQTYLKNVDMSEDLLSSYDQSSEEKKDE